MSIDWSDYPNFERHEFQCRCGCGRADMSPLFMGQLQALRIFLDFPFPINSGFRCDRYNKDIGGGIPHTIGMAADISVFGRRYVSILSNFEDFGFTGIGANQKGAHVERFVHLDCLPPDHHPDAPRPWGWTY